MMKKKTAQKTLGILAMFMAAVFLLAAGSVGAFAADVSQTFEFEMNPRDERKQPITVYVPKAPPSADVIFSFDLTGSMGGILSTAKSNAISMMEQLSALGSDISFGVVSYMDYDGYYESAGYADIYGVASDGDYPYAMNCAVTKDKNAVSDTISGLSLGYGRDYPEAYTRILFESYSDGSIGWRSGAKKIFVNFGDSLPHDDDVNSGIPGKTDVLSTGIDPGRDTLLGTADDLDLQEVVAGMAANNIILLACQTEGSFLEYWSHWAGLTGGEAYNTNASDVAEDVVAAISKTLLAPNVEQLRLVPEETEFGAWITDIQAPYYSGPTDVHVPFTVTLKMPEGTAPGVYTFHLKAIDANNVQYGRYRFIITYPDSVTTTQPETTAETTEEQTIPQTGSPDGFGIPPAALMAVLCAGALMAAAAYIARKKA
ncbi:MAG TPA: VWA domain-containing protein [Clostridiales bacterium]|nr:VWA domain-containing protein [Clostridiales bacterium]